MHEVPLIPPPQTPPPPKGKSALVPTGIAFLLAGIVLPRPVRVLAEQLPDGLLRALAFISTDVLRLCFFVGLTMIIIGALRNRKR